LTGRGGLIGLEANLDVTTAEPATEMTSVAAVAPAKGALRPRRHICITAWAGWLTVHARRHQRGSQPAFAWGDVAVKLNPYPAENRPAFAFSLTRYPQPRRLILRLAFPKGELRAYHVASRKRCVG
jgi:hypothetical protein